MSKGTVARVLSRDPLYRGLRGVVESETRTGWVLVWLCVSGFQKLVSFRREELAELAEPRASSPVR